MTQKEKFIIAQIIGRLEVIQCAISNQELETANLDSEVRMLAKMIRFNIEPEYN